MQKVKTLSDVIVSESQGIPIILRVVAKKQAHIMEGGTMASPISNEIYVCLSQLPDELKEKVKTFVQLALKP